MVELGPNSDRHNKLEESGYGNEEEGEVEGGGEGGIGGGEDGGGGGAIGSR